jgi:hypothetical protein
MSAFSITVIVPTRHRTAYAAVAARSIQTSAAEAARSMGVRTRVLIVDDAPDNDDTKDMARELGVDYLRVEEHDGLADPGAAIKLGVESVDTTYQTIFGDDDIMLPRHITAASEMLSEGYDVVSSSFQVADDHLKPFRLVVLEPTCLGDLVAGYTMVNDGSFVAHDLVKDLEWDVALEGQMLVPVWGELMLLGRSFGIVEEPTWLYRRHDANISHGALSDHDRQLRAVAQERLRERTIQLLGQLPPSPRAAFLAEQERQRRRQEIRSGRVVVAGEFAAHPKAFVRRGRNKLARAIIKTGRLIAG